MPPRSPNSKADLQPFINEMTIHVVQCNLIYNMTMKYKEISGSSALSLIGFVFWNVFWVGV
jgi:hypothetical protein